MSKIQYLAAGIGPANSDRVETQIFKAGGAISAADWVALDNSQTAADKALYVVEASGSLGVVQPLVVGVSLNTVSAGERVEVVVRGYVASASISGSCSAGSSLVVDATDGKADLYAGSDTTSPCGVCLGTVTAEIAEAYVIRKF